ncbi:MAG: hypothetical protein WDN06_11135 [Asticcacaulis sp.]
MGDRENKIPEYHDLGGSFGSHAGSLKENQKDKTTDVISTPKIPVRVDKAPPKSNLPSSDSITKGENEKPEEYRISDYYYSSRSNIRGITRCRDVIESFNGKKLTHADDIFKLSSAWGIILLTSSYVMYLHRSMPEYKNLELPDRPEAYYSYKLCNKPSDFLLAYYGKYLAAGILFRPKLKELDKKLATALAKEFRGRPKEFRKLLPTKSDAVNKRMRDVADGTASPEERKKPFIMPQEGMRKPALLEKVRHLDKAIFSSFNIFY